jgi:phosphatidylglycerophosphatase A
MPRPPPSEDRPLFVDSLPPGGWPRGHMFLCWFGLGMINRAPGTLASLGCLPIAAVIVWIGGQFALAVAAALVFALGYGLTAAYVRRVPDDKDPQWIVIDEVAAQWATLVIVPLDPAWYALGFGLFRLFDIFKPWPVSWADRKPGTFGIMVDDMLAAVYAGAILWAIRHFWLQAA